MKIESATILYRPHASRDVRYSAKVIVSNEGQNYVDEAYAETPDEAVNKAFSCSVKVISDKLRAGLRIDYKVSL